MVIGILVSLVLLMLIAYRGLSVILFAPFCAMLAALTAGYDVLPMYSEIFMSSAGAYVKNFFPLFMLGAVFGKVMEDSGMARSIAKWVVLKLGPSRAILAIILASTLLAYGGVSMFVIAFAVYPFANSLFMESGTPRRLIPGCIALGAFACTMTALPGSPQIQNLIPTKYFGTDAYAAPGFGITGAILIYGLSLLWLEWHKRKMLAAGEGYGRPDTRHAAPTIENDIPDVNAGLAFLPLLVVLVLNFVLTQMFKTWDPSVMAVAAKYPLASATVPGPTWALIVALIVGTILAVVISNRQFRVRRNLVAAINGGTIGSLLAIMNTASETGYGNIVSSLPGFAAVRDFLMGIGGGHPLFSEAIMVNILAGISGSASGGMSIALEAMGSHFMEIAQQAGIDPGMLHRVAAMASGGLDTLPHNGAVITLLAICGLSHKESYPDICMTSVIIPIVVVFALIPVWDILGFSLV